MIFWKKNGGMKIWMAYGKEEFEKLSSQAAATF